MYTHVVRPEHLEPDQLDTFLEQGWYRIGMNLVSCRFVLFEGVLRSAIWTRLPLRGYTFRKGLRRILAANGRRFTHRFGPLEVTPEKERLYERYRRHVGGSRSESLTSFLGNAPEGLYDTREVTLWDGDRLVGFSLFDVGATSVESLLGVYDPDDAQHGVGFYTLLLEIQWGLDHGFAHHYSGYVLPGEPAMDYKRRVGPLEFRDHEQRSWRPLTELPSYALPTDRFDAALDAALDAMHHVGISGARRCDYPMYEAPSLEPSLRACLDQPAFVLLPSAERSSTSLLVTWDLDDRAYRILRCNKALGRRVVPGPKPLEESVDLWVVVERLSSRSTPQDIAAEAHRIWSWSSAHPLGRQRRGG